MTIKELEARLSSGAILSLTGRDKLKAVGGNEYRINPCPICGHKDHFTLYSHTNSYNTFSDCAESKGLKKGGGVYRYLIDIAKLSEDQAREKLEEMAGYTPEAQDLKDKKTAPAMIESMETEPVQLFKDHTQLANKLYDTSLSEAKSYFINRGIGQALIEKYKLSVFNDTDGRRAFLPIWKDGKVIYYTKRALDGQEPRYKNAPGQAQLFNLEALEQAQAGDVVIITEGIFDALAAEETAGIMAVALGGVEHYSKAAQAINQAADRGVILLTAFDNDEAGAKARETAGLPFIEIPAHYKDLSEWSLSDPATGDMILTQLERAQRPEAASHYLEHEFYQAIQRYKQYQGIETGFSNLDYYLGGFFPGLVVIGGVSAVGKTTFAHQLGDQLAERGRHVIYFSLEQSKFEMISKSISRETARLDVLNPVTSLKIRSGAEHEIIGRAVERYKETAQRVNIVEGNFGLNVTAMKEYISRYMIRNNVKPVVIIDYLQILPGDPRMSDKQRIDTNVTELKRLSRDFDITVIAISSLNRASYTTPVTMEAFKESGGIEYTADIVIGLQLEAIRDKCKDEDKQEKLRQAKEKAPRDIELVCLKNRNGRTFSCLFSYDQRYDYYSAKTVKDKKQQRL